MTVARGTFQHRSRARQLLRFDGLQWGTITPTDFDLFIDFGGQGFVLGELKYGDTPVKRGQELALERAADGWERGGIRTLIVIASHHVSAGDVLVASAIVTRYRFGLSEWEEPAIGRTVAEWVADFYEMFIKAA